MKKTICILLLASLCLMLCACNNPNTNVVKYTVTFYGNENVYFRYDYSDGDAVIRYTNEITPTIYRTTEVVNNNYVNEPPPPTNDPYLFLGWYQNPECTEIFIFGYHQINSDINLYAKWGNIYR